MRLQRMSSNLLDIIRMEREGIERAGVEGLMGGVQGMGIWRESEILLEMAGQKEVGGKLEPARPDPVGVCDTHSVPATEGLPPVEIGWCQAAVTESLRHAT